MRVSTTDCATSGNVNSRASAAEAAAAGDAVAEAQTVQPQRIVHRPARVEAHGAAAVVEHAVADLAEAAEQAGIDDAADGVGAAVMQILQIGLRIAARFGCRGRVLRIGAQRPDVGVVVGLLVGAAACLVGSGARVARRRSSTTGEPRTHTRAVSVDRDLATSGERPGA